MFRSPGDRRVDYVKRVIALAGDEVTVTEQGVSLKRPGEVTGQPIPLRALAPIRFCDFDDSSGHWQAVEGPAYQESLEGTSYRVLTSPSAGPDRCPPPQERPRCGPGERCYGCGERVPEGHFFALGDHRHNSHDSRTYGPVPLENIKGRVIGVWYSHGGDPERGCEAGVRWDRLAHFVP